ncbi:MAG: hypothetical protein JKY89_10830 [Immundisolibacteraceae bacterium]|nr:hypothetical protein [Immundisolibacteraceae bacterium]
MIIKLLPGNESAERVALLLEFTRIESEPLIKAINNHLVNGQIEAMAVVGGEVKQQNLARAMVALNKANVTVEKIKAHDWKHIHWSEQSK